MLLDGASALEALFSSTSLKSESGKPDLGQRKIINMDDHLITSLVEGSQGHNSPWPTCSFDEDFILLSEFSELEGPRPVLTVPENGGGSFSKSTFAVRVMSVDCTSPISQDPGSPDSASNFITEGDTQVVLLEPSEGAASYVHHFTLYDIHARGFVRPFCMAYMTHQYSKIMNNFKIFRDYFTRVSAFLRFGNGLIFLSDLYHRKGYLNYVKTLLTANKDLPENFPREMKAFSLPQIEENIKDTENLIKTVISYLKSSQFTEQLQRKHLNEQLKMVIVNKDMTEESCAINVKNIEDNSEDILVSKEDFYSRVSPQSIGISSGRKYDVQLRDIDKLCCPAKQEALGLLHKIYLSFRSTRYLSSLHEVGTTFQNIQEHHQNGQVDCIPKQPRLRQSLPINSFLKPKRKEMVDEQFVSDSKDEDSLKNSFYETSRFKDQHSSGSSSLSRIISPSQLSKIWDPNVGIFDDVLSCRNYSSFEVIRTHSNSPDEEFAGALSKEFSINYLYPGIARRVKPAASDETDHPFSHLYRQMSSKSEGSVGSSKGSSDESTSQLSFRDVSSMTSDSLPGYLPDDGERDYFKRPAFFGSYDKIDLTSVSSRKSNLSFTGMNSGILNEQCFSDAESLSSEVLGSFASFFNIPSSIQDGHGISLMILRHMYSFLPHLVYSLLIGRPVLINARRKNRPIVHSIIRSLLPCVPGLGINQKAVVFWTKGPFHLSSLSFIKLIGIAKQRGQSAVPNSVKPYVSVLDYEAQSLWAPAYNGTFLNELLDSQKHWPSEAVFLDFMHTAQNELSAQAFISFGMTYFEKKDSSSTVVLKKGAAQSHIGSVRISARGLSQYKLVPDDIKMIDYLTDLLKDQVQDSFVANVGGVSGEGFSSFAESSSEQLLPIKLNTLKCQLFQNQQGKKK